MKRVSFHNLGCKVNAYETAAMEQKLQDAGYQVVSFNEPADIVIVNTCSVTNMADKKSRQMLHRAKRKNPDALVIAAGCYVQTKTDEVKADEAVDVIVGNNEKKNIVCYAYDSFLSLGPGFFFADAALEVKVNNRNATIRAEDDTYLACLKNNDYLNIIAPKRRFEKAKAIAFLFNTFFFQQINPHLFERNYYHRFYLKKYKKNSVLFDYGTIPKNLFLVKEGQISLDLKISIIDIHNLIKFIYSNILNNSFFKDLSKNKTSMVFQ